MSGKPPPNFWGIMMSAASAAIALIALVIGTSKTDRDDTRQNERRICRIEAITGVGECKR